MIQFFTVKICDISTPMKFVLQFALVWFRKGSRPSVNENDDVNQQIVYCGVVLDLLVLRKIEKPSRIHWIKRETNFPVCVEG